MKEMEGMLSSSNGPTDLGVIGVTPALINSNTNNYSGTGNKNMMLRSDEMAMNAQSALQQPSGEMNFHATGEDLNDRLIDSPKQRKYVPLLSKKLKKTNHGSSENVIATVGRADNHNANSNSMI